MSVLGTAERPLRVAIIGSGPSGFYSAEALLKQNLNNVGKRGNVDLSNEFRIPVARSHLFLTQIKSTNSEAVSSISMTKLSILRVNQL